MKNQNKKTFAIIGLLLPLVALTWIFGLLSENDVSIDESRIPHTLGEWDAILKEVGIECSTFNCGEVGVYCFGEDMSREIEFDTVPLREGALVFPRCHLINGGKQTELAAFYFSDKGELPEGSYAYKALSFRDSSGKESYTRAALRYDTETEQFIYFTQGGGYTVIDGVIEWPRGQRGAYYWDESLDQPELVEEYTNWGEPLPADEWPQTYGSFITPTFGPVSRYQILEKKDLGENNVAVVQEQATGPVVGIALLDKEDRFIRWLEGGGIKEERRELIGPGEYFEQLIVEDINKDGLLEIVVQLSYAGTALRKPLYVYQQSEDGVSYELILKLVNPVSDFYLEDLNSDEIDEIVYSYSLSGAGGPDRTFTKWIDVFRWVDGFGYFERNDLFPEIYTQLIEEYEQFWQEPYISEFHKEVLMCLYNVAVKTSEGRQLISAANCYDWNPD